MTTRRQILQSTSALALVAVLPRCATVNKNGGGPGISPNPALLADIPRSDYGFATTCDEVTAGYDLAGKTVLITGCNSGLGFESMRTLVARGAHVIGTARTLEKAEEACGAVTDGYDFYFGVVSIFFVNRVGKVRQLGPANGSPGCKE